MTQTKDEAKIASLEQRRKRWQSRLKRSVTELDKIDRALKRLNKPKKGLSSALEAVVDAVELPKPEAKPVPVAAAELVEKKDKDIPSFLDRSDPLIAERMTAARKKAEEAERHKMPLTGKAAMEYLKQPKKKRASAAGGRGV